MRRIPLLLLLLIPMILTSGMGKISLSGAEAVRNISLTKADVETEQLPIVNIFAFNELARMEEDLSSGEVSTKAQGLKEIFIFRQDSTVRASLKSTSVHTSAAPLMRPFLLHEGLPIESRLSYPRELIGDGQVPLLKDVTVSNLTSTSAEIQWATNEHSDSFVAMGSDPSNLTNRFGTSLLDLNHSVLLIGLSPGTVYYYQAMSTDRDGMTGFSDVLDLVTPG